VVVSDLSGSTALGERLDPESLSQVMARYYEAMRAVVLHHGGTVEAVGDAVHAVFGVPAAHEDDALRAVRAAAGMHAALDELNQRLAGEGRVRLELHTGVNTGEVVAGDPNLGSLVVGDAVNLAARLEQAAGPGEILLGHGTWSLVRDAVEVEPPQVVATPGREDGEPAYRLMAVRPGTAGRARRLDAPFVGRASELQLFRWAYERAAGEAALHLLTVLGGAGVGKTRLVLEAAAGLPGDPAVLAGRCLPYGNGSTFWPLAEVVRQAAGIGLDDPPAAARAKLAAVVEADPDRALVAERIGQLIGLEAAPAPIEEAVWSTRRLLQALAAGRPLVAVFDDLHWAEPTFLDLLEQLAETTQEGPILLVAVGRPELLEQRPGWAGGRPNALSVLLEPLGPDDSGALLDGLAGGGALPAQARERICRAAGGNPLFIEELLATLVEEGRLRRRDGGWEVAGDLAGTGIPPTIQALVAARLDRLDGRDRDVLERAAVVGLAFEQATVAELTPEAARAEVPERLRGLVRRELLRTAPARRQREAGYQFRHLLVRDAVYQGVPKGVRAELHERLAGLLEARAGARVREYEEIVGYHLEQAWRCLAELGPIERRGRELGARAAGRLAAAGRRALARGDTPAATALLDRALAVLPGGDPARGHLLNDLAESLVAAGDFGRAGEVLTAATVAAEAGGDGDGLLAQVAVGRLGMRLLIEPGLPLDAIQGEVESAIAALEVAGDDRGLARAWRLLGYESFMRCRIERAEAALARTIEHARRAADERVDAYAQGDAGRGRLLGPVAGRRGGRALPPAAGGGGRQPLRRGQRPPHPRRPGRHAGPLRPGARPGRPGGRGRGGPGPAAPRRHLEPVRGYGRVAGRPARGGQRTPGPRLPGPGADGGDRGPLQPGRRPRPQHGPWRPPRRGQALRRGEPGPGRPRGRLRPGPLAGGRRQGPGRRRRRRSRPGGPPGQGGGRPGRGHRHAEPPGRRPGRPGRDGGPVGPARGGGRGRRPQPAPLRAQGQPGGRGLGPGPPRPGRPAPGRRLRGLSPPRRDLPPGATPGKISDAGGFGKGVGEAGMPHWGFRENQRDLPGQLLDAISRALYEDFHPADAGRLLELGRALGRLGRLTAEDPDFQVKVQDSRDALAAAVQAVLAEATEEAGDRPVDPELLATLTEALAAAFDQGR
jgi:class 3 adenylate cyclase/tetratricopeptide (TPR) repeat protein